MLREQGLADAARADDADQPVAIDQPGQRLQLAGAPEQGGELGGQMGAQRCGDGGGAVAAGRRRRRRSARRRSRGGRRGRFERRDKAIAASGDGRDHVAADHLSQRADLRGEVVLLHHEARPDEVHQRVLADQLAGPLGQRQQQVERAATERSRRAVHEQAALVGLQFETAEAQRRSSPRRAHGGASNSWLRGSA
jgi:hypothetical protein